MEIPPIISPFTLRCDTRNNRLSPGGASSGTVIFKTQLNCIPGSIRSNLLMFVPLFGYLKLQLRCLHTASCYHRGGRLSVLSLAVLHWVGSKTNPESSGIDLIISSL
jgi:hypothetical protein